MDTAVGRLDDQSYAECFTPKKVLRRTPPLNRLLDKENDPILPEASATKNKKSGSPNIKTAKKSSSVQVQGNRRKRGRPSKCSKNSTPTKRTCSQMESNSSNSRLDVEEALASSGGVPVDLKGSRDLETSCFTPRKALQCTPPSNVDAVTKGGKGVQDVCFTPKRCLQRTPPGIVRGTAQEENDEVQGSCFTPRRSLRHSPAKVQDSLVEESARGSSVSTRMSLKRSLSQRDGTEHKRGVQASCFTMTKTLRRSHAPSQESQSDLVNAISPPSKLEITYTPPMKVYSTSNPGPGFNAALTATQSLSASHTHTSPGKANVHPTAVPNPSCQSKGLTKTKGKSTASHGQRISKSPIKNGVTGLGGAKPVQIQRTATTCQNRTMLAQDGLATSSEHIASQSPAATDLSAALEDEANAVPPSSCWEIPRTPVQATTPLSTASNGEFASVKTNSRPQTATLQLSASPSTSSRDISVTPPGPHHIPTPRRTPSFEIASNIIESMADKSPPMEPVHFENIQLSPSKGLARTPTRTKVPAHPLSVTNLSKLGPQSFPSGSKISPSKSSRNDDIKIQQEASVISGPPGTNSLSAGQSALAGLQCTDEDLAFLERRHNLARLRELQVQSKRLAKEERAANEEKELLEHAAVKIQLDIDAMRARYRGTAGALLAMIEDPHLTTLSEVVDSPLRGNGVTAGALPAVRESDLAQLKKLNQQAASQVDKLDRKLAERKAELESERAARQKLMEKEDERRRLLEDKIAEAEAQKTLLIQKLAGLETRSASIEEEAKLLHCELARLENANTVKLLEDRSVRRQQRAIIEERLKILIRRCDLYCKRQRMLRDMGIIKRSRKT